MDHRLDAIRYMTFLDYNVFIETIELEQITPNEPFEMRESEHAFQKEKKRQKKEPPQIAR